MPLVKILLKSVVRKGKTYSVVQLNSSVHSPSEPGVLFEFMLSMLLRTSESVIILSKSESFTSCVFAVMNHSYPLQHGQEEEDLRTDKSDFANHKVLIYW